MSITRFLAPTALAGGLFLSAVAGITTAGAATGPGLPQPASASAGATWLADQFSGGAIPQSGDPSQPDLSSTANAVLALAATGTQTATADAGVTTLEADVDAYVAPDGTDEPASLALLILDAEATGTDPTSFGGTDLVTRLLATQQVTGTDAGLFGTEDQADNYLAGDYQQGLALAALAAAGLTSGTAVTSADQWLLGQQCPDGGWTTYVTEYNPCNGDPADYAGPDTNSTALAVEGLVAQGALTGKPASKALAWIRGAQDADAGWGYEPNASDAPGSTDPDSTALVLQAVLALGRKPQSAMFTVSGVTPVQTLESFQLTGGTDAGAFSYPGISGADLLATYQAVPAVAGVRFPFSLRITTASLPGATARQPYSATVDATGGSAPYTFKIVTGTGTLPKGIKLDKATGVLSGTPKTAGTSTVTVEVLDAKAPAKPRTQDTAFATLTLTVAG